MRLDLDLPYANQQPRRAVPKGATRLMLTKADTKREDKEETAFKADVWKRDGGKCRCCQRKVSRRIERVVDRGEVHHLHGRAGKLRYEVRAAILACLECHEELTGKVGGHKLIAKATKTFKLLTKDGWKTFTDATYPVTFRHV